MKVKDGFVVRDVAGQAVVIATGAASETFHGMVKLNATGKLIWEHLARGASVEEIVRALTEAFEVDDAQARADVEAFIARMDEAGFLE